LIIEIALILINLIKSKEKKREKERKKERGREG